MTTETPKKGRKKKDPPTDPPPLVLRVEQAARMLQMGRTKCSELILSGLIPSVKIGGMRRVPVEALRRWIESLTPDYDPDTFDREVRGVIEAARQR